MRCARESLGLSRAPVLLALCRGRVVLHAMSMLLWRSLSHVDAQSIRLLPLYRKDA